MNKNVNNKMRQLFIIVETPLKLLYCSGNLSQSGKEIIQSNLCMIFESLTVCIINNFVTTAKHSSLLPKFAQASTKTF
jgi:hypothetical protein